MEEVRLLLAFIRRLSQNAGLRQETAHNVTGVCQREGLSTQAVPVISRILPRLALAGETQGDVRFTWWY